MTAGHACSWTQLRVKGVLVKVDKEELSSPACGVSTGPKERECNWHVNKTRWSSCMGLYQLLTSTRPQTCVPSLQPERPLPLAFVEGIVLSTSLFSLFLCMWACVCVFVCASERECVWKVSVWVLCVSLHQSALTQLSTWKSVSYCHKKKKLMIWYIYTVNIHTAL